jgi:hypothetical protein
MDDDAHARAGHVRHAPGDRPHHPDDDRAALRALFGVLVVLLTAVAGIFLWGALMTRPDGPWDEAAYGGIELGCVLAILSAGAVGALWAAPSVRSVMRWPWWMPALSVGLAAVVRWVTGGA